VANEVARRVVTPPHRDGGQAQYIRHTSATSVSRRDVQEWARRNLADVTVAGMADYAGVSARTLNRQFRNLTGLSPQAWLQRLRLDTAAEFLEASDMAIDTIARRVGLGTATNLRAHFKAAYGLPPLGYRRTFQPPKTRTA
jgi:transcriptional regulator GlxA family with amidase domain